MSGLLGLLQTTKMTIFAQEMALGILNHNIANSNTPGYHRQRVNLSTGGSLIGLGGGLGGGVQIDGVQRFANMFLGNQIGRAKADHGEQSTLARHFGIMETIFGEPADEVMGEVALGDVISDFLSAWQPVVNPEMDSEDADTRGLIIEIARNMTYRFNTLARNILDQAQSLRDDVSTKVTEVNSLLAEVGQLNQELGNSALSDSGRADLEDSRDVKLNRLSQLIGAEWSFSEQGDLNVYVGGRVLVNHVTVHGLEARPAAGGRIDSMRLYPFDDNYDMAPAGGEIKGLLQMLDVELPELLGRLDSLAEGVIDKVNGIHQAATGDGGGGVDFFTGTDASTISVSNALINNPDLVSLSGLLPDGRDIASAIFDLHTETIDGERGLTIEGLYASMIGHLGSRAASANQLSMASERLENGLATQLESEVGVSIDEEMAEMMIVQTTYQAASKVMTAINDMLEVLLTAF